jgi:hypothetical protein
MVMPANPQPLLPLFQALDRAGLLGSLEISGVCDAKSFPQFSQLGQKANNSIPTMLSEMLPSDHSFRVTQDPNGLIRVIEPDVAADFLKLRISHIAFEDSKHRPLFHANHAMSAVLSTPEVVAFIRSNDIQRLPLLESAGGDLPLSNSPHIGGTLDNVTVQEALDRILQTFPGVWLYEDCPQNQLRKHAFFLRFYRLDRTRNRVFGDS